MKKAKLSALLLVVVLIFSLLSGCTPAPQPAAPTAAPTEAPVETATEAPAEAPVEPVAEAAKEAAPAAANLPAKKIVFGFQVAASRFDPLEVVQENIGGRCVGEMVFEPLIMSDGMGNFFPWLAESYEVNEDATEWVFKIRQDVTFSNGEVMNADDVVCTYERVIANYEVPRFAGVIRNVFPQKLLESVEKIDDYTVKIQLAYSYANSLLSFTDVVIIPNEAFAARGDELFQDHSVNGYYGTGPWIMQGQITGQSANYKKNPNYWNKNFDSYYDEVEFIFISEQSTAIAACISGNIQAYIPGGGIRKDLLPQFDSVKDKFDVFKTGQRSFYYLQFQSSDGKTFQNQELRKAFWMSVDFESILEYVLGGGTTMTQWIPEGFEGYDPSLPPYEYNPEEAKKILEASGYNGEELGLYSATGTFMSEDQMLAIADCANAVGFNCKVYILENASLQGIRESGQYDIFMAPANFADASPTVNIMARIRNDQDKHDFWDDELMGQLDSAAATFDKETREAHYRAAMARIRELWGPMIGMYYADAYAAVGYGIEGIELAIGSQIYATFVDFNEENPSSTVHGVDWETLRQGL